jgi:hypothetical protein
MSKFGEISQKNKIHRLVNMSDGLENWTYKYLQSNVFIWNFFDAARVAIICRKRSTFWYDM